MYMSGHMSGHGGPRPSLQQRPNGLKHRVEATVTMFLDEEAKK